MAQSDKDKQISRDVDFLYEIGCLRFIQRTWRQFLGAQFANLAEHHLRVMWTALILAKHEGVKNTEKVLKMALVHDIAESRTGDVNYLQRQYVKRLETEGLNDMVADTILADELVALVAEYQQRESIEAKIVKDADNLDVDFELREQQVRGHDFGPGWMEIRKHVSDTKFYTKSAKKLWQQLQESHPHDWHFKAKNRYQGGDWKEGRKAR